MEYSNSYGDFVATPATGTTNIVFTSLSIPFGLDIKHFAFATIYKQDSQGTLSEIVLPGKDVTFSSNILTISGITNFQTGDKVFVKISGPPRAQDTSLDVQKYINMSPDSMRYTTPEPIVSSLILDAAMEGTYVDATSSINIETYSHIGLFIDYTANATVDLVIRLVGLKSSDSSGQEYDLYGVSNLSFTEGVNVSEYYEFDIGTLPFLKVQTTVTTAGSNNGGSDGSVDIQLNKQWRS